MACPVCSAPDGHEANCWLSDATHPHLLAHATRQLYATNLAVTRERDAAREETERQRARVVDEQAALAEAHTHVAQLRETVETLAQTGDELRASRQAALAIVRALAECDPFVHGECGLCGQDWADADGNRHAPTCLVARAKALAGT